MNSNIFIHIPKTGGTTINCAINNTQWQTVPDFNYRHIIYETKRSNSGDIFNPVNYSKYENYNIFMILRHPVDRLISEYYFINKRTEFMSELKSVPKNFESYIANKQTQNYMVGFLLGKKMFDTDLVTKDDLELVINTIRNLNIKVGIFEEFEKSLYYFSKSTNIKWPKKIDIKRITLNRPTLDEVSSEHISLIEKHNALDLQLYNYCLDVFKKETAEYSNTKNFQFKGDKYNYVIKYTQRFNLLEISQDNLPIIKEQQIFFTDLNNYLHHNLKIKDGKQYVNLWNSYVSETIKKEYPNSSLTNSLESIDNKEPLELTLLIAKALKLHYNTKNYSNILIFNKNLVEYKQPLFIDKLFGLLKK